MSDVDLDGGPTEDETAYTLWEVHEQIRKSRRQAGRPWQPWDSGLHVPHFLRRAIRQLPIAPLPSHL